MSEEVYEESAVQLERLYSLRHEQGGTYAQHLSKPAANAARPRSSATGALTCVCFCPSTRRLYYGLDTGQVFFWVLEASGHGRSRFVGEHSGPVTAICAPQRGDGELGDLRLVLSASVDGNVKIWDYVGRVLQDPTVCVQTLYGHASTVTGVFVYGQHVLSCSTDKTIRAWKSVEGRKHLKYPWIELEVRDGGVC
eukprot:365413-Chlamydomonas_euryale.AAC.11